MLKKFTLKSKDEIIKLLRHDLVKVFSMTGISTLVRMIAGVVSTKIIAVQIGPAGVALLGQLGNFSSILMSIATGGFTNGITKYISEFKEDIQTCKKIISTSFLVILGLSVSVGIVLISLPHYFSVYLFKTDKYHIVFMVFGVTILFYSLNQYLIAIINGFKKFRLFILINIITSIVGLIFTIFLVFKLGVVGALLSSVTYQSIIFFITYWMVKREYWFVIRDFFHNFDKKIIYKLFNYSLISFFAIFTAPVADIFIRTRIINMISINEAGLWDSVTKLSSIYLSIITTSLSVYILPRYSELTDERKLRHEIFKTYKFIMPIVMFTAASIFIFRDLIIKLLYTNSFSGMRDLFLLQLTGDFFKIFSWILGYLFLAKAMTKEYILSQLFFYIIYPSMVLLFMPKMGVQGVLLGYTMSYFIFSLLMIFIFRKLIFLKPI